METDEITAATVLNGEVVVGDRVALAVSNSGGLRLGTILAFREVSRYSRTEVEAQVNIEKTSGWAGHRYVRGESGGRWEYRAYRRWYPVGDMAKVA